MIDRAQLQSLRAVCVEDGYALLDAAVAAAGRSDWSQVQALALQLRSIALAADDLEWADHALELGNAPISAVHSLFPAWSPVMHQLLEIALYRR